VSDTIYIAMNHFRVAAGRAAEFERVWRERESHLDGVPGFVEFHLVRGRDRKDGSHRYASHVVWRSQRAFLDWTHSDAFRKAHGQRRTPEGLLLGHPRFRGWQAIDLGR
jgi:heme-degrading monooxygenase HmoA